MEDLPLKKISLNVARRRANEIQGRRTALAIFPEEVWRLILKDVTAPTDLYNVSQATRQLDDILSTEKGQIFFSKIFPIMFPYLDTPSIYNCHLVCKQWNSTIDTTLLYQTPSQISNRIKSKKESYAPLRLSSSFQVDSAEENFLSTWDVPSFIEIDLSSDRPDIFWNKVKKLLHQFSPKVYHLRFVGCSRYAPAGLYECLVETFVILPNIKVLEIECWNEHQCMDIRINGLKRVIRESTPPPLKNLEKMRLDFGNVPPEFLQEILKVYGKQVRNLELRFSCGENDHKEIWKNLEFPVLERLVLDTVRFTALCDVLECVGTGRNLKVLSLVVPQNRLHEEASIYRLLKCLIGLKENLKFFQVFGENEDLRDWFVGILGELMGTWIEYNKMDCNDRHKVYYFIHAGPDFCG